MNQFPDIGATIDSAFNTYLQTQAFQKQQEQAEKDRQRQATLQNLQLQSQFGPGVTMEALAANPNAFQQGAQAAQNQGPLPADGDPLTLAFANWHRKRQASEALGVRKENAEIGKTEAGAVKDKAEAMKALAEANKANNPNGDPAHKPSQSEYAARGFADKAQQAHAALAELEASGFNPAATSNALTALLPNAAQSDSLQQSEQARRQFVNAVLRRESGAAISPSEMDSYTRQYFPVAGDSAKVRQQKAAARELAIRGLAAEAQRVPTQLGESKQPGSDLAALAAQKLAARRAAAPKPGGMNGPAR